MNKSSLLKNGNYGANVISKNGNSGVRMDVFAFYIFTPMRCVRTAKRDVDSVQPKSRLIIPGHEDPLMGTYRTDAPLQHRSR